MDNNDKIFWGSIGREQVLKADLDASSHGIIITDFHVPDNPIIYCNKAFEELSGYTRAEIVGKNCRFLQAEDRFQSGRYKMKLALQEEKECHVEIVNFRKDGSSFWNELYIAPIKDKNGKTAYYIGIQNDITELKLKGINLKFGRKHLHRLEQLKNEFLTAASHELKTPLTSLKASLQLLSRLIDKDLTDTKQQMLLNKANLNVNKLTALVEDLLHVSQTESGRALHEHTTFLLGVLVSKAVQDFGFDARHEISITGDRNLEVTADYGRIEQVVVNLLNNAVKYAPHQKHIQVYMENWGDEAKISITDFGEGIAPTDLPYIFDRYYRGAHSDAQISGLGIGLYTSREIIRSHQGQIGVYSEPGKGSTFYFTLPLVHK